jgi:hypothetical protein
MAFKEGIFTRGVLFDMARHKGVHDLGGEEVFYPRRFRRSTGGPVIPIATF